MCGSGVGARKLLPFLRGVLCYKDKEKRLKSGVFLPLFFEKNEIIFWGYQAF